MPPKARKQRPTVYVHPDTEKAWNLLVSQLLDLGFDPASPGNEPVVVRLDNDARLAWNAFYDQWAIEQENAEGDLASALAKLEGYAARFALIHHMVGVIEDPGRPAALVQRDSVLAGCRLCRWFADEAGRVYALMGESEQTSHLRKLIDFIARKGGEMTARNLQNANGRKYPDAESAKQGLQAVVDAGLGEWVTRKAKGGVGGHAYNAVRLKASDTSDNRTQVVTPQEVIMSASASDASPTPSDGRPDASPVVGQSSGAVGHPSDAEADMITPDAASTYGQVSDVSDGFGEEREREPGEDDPEEQPSPPRKAVTLEEQRDGRGERGVPTTS
jgi:hypothetical protein